MESSTNLPNAAVPPVSADSTPQPVGNWRHGFSFWFNTFCGVVTIVSLIVAVYFYQASKIKPLLTFAVNPLKAELQRPDYDKDLGFVYKGKPVDSESVTSVEVSVWNAGTRSIKEVLEHIRLVMPDGSAILSVRIKNASRPICKFKLLGSPEDYKRGICPITWNILEQDDGAVLQIIYAGRASVDPTLEGIVEGQKDIVVEKYSLTPDRKGIVGKVSVIGLVVVVIFLSVAGVLLLILTKPPTKTEEWAEEKARSDKRLAELSKKTVRPRYQFVIFAGICVCIVIVILVAIASDSRPGPPFGW